MAKRKRPSDPNRPAAEIVAEATGNTPKPRKKNPHAVALGRRGGKVGGPRRAAALTKKRRSEIARSAAQARWKGVNSRGKNG